MEPADHAVVLYDGVCNVCNESVQFILARDKVGYFHFASLQSEVGKELLAQHGLADLPLSTMVLIEKGRAYVKSTAVMRVARRLTPFWVLSSYALALLPRPLRDALYAGFVKHRYRWFGRKQACFLPDTTQRRRFIGM